MSTEREQDRVPALLIERLALGELPEERRQEVLQRLEQEPGGAERLAELEASSRAILASHPPARIAAEIERRHGRRRTRERLWLATGLATATAALLVVLVSPRLFRADPEDGLRPKGDPILTIYRKAASGAEELRGGVTVRSGDLLQIGFASGAAAYGVIFSVDGGGAVTLHFPRTSSESTRLEGAPRLLPYAYELDDAPGHERFFFVTAREPVDPEQVLRLGRALGGDARKPLRLPPGAAVVEVLLLKPALEKVLR